MPQVVQHQTRFTRYCMERLHHAINGALLRHCVAWQVRHGQQSFLLDGLPRASSEHGVPSQQPAPKQSALGCGQQCIDSDGPDGVFGFQAVAWVSTNVQVDSRRVFDVAKA